jgi:hypothetical protein
MATDFPLDIEVLSAEWYLNSNTKTFRSPLSGVTQTLELPGAYWSAVLNIDNQSPDQSQVISAFLTSLRGRAISFNLFDHSHPEPRGVATGTPIVYGAGQVGSQLITGGWTADTTGILKAGDYIQVGLKLKMVVIDAYSDSLGRSTLTIEPPWADSPADGATVVTSYPKAVMRLSSDKSGLKTKAPLLSSVSIDCVEDMTV